MAYYYDLYGFYLPGATEGHGSTEVVPPPQESWDPGFRPLWNVLPNEWYMSDWVPQPPTEAPDPLTIQQIKDQLQAIDIRKVRAITDAVLSGGWDTARLQQLEQECQVLRGELHALGYYGEQQSVAAAPEA